MYTKQNYLSLKNEILQLQISIVKNLTIQDDLNISTDIIWYTCPCGPQIEIIANNRKWYKTIAALSHEFGHFKSWCDGYDYKSSNNFEKILEECQAWKIGFALLKKNKIKINYKIVWFACTSIYSHFKKLYVNKI